MMKKFLKDRKKAFTKAVMEDDWDGVMIYCKRYGIQVPEDRTIMKAGIYKAVQECTDISDGIKAIAAKKCIELGFFPFIREWE